jgi:hypothetical protein
MSLASPRIRRPLHSDPGPSSASHTVRPRDRPSWCASRCGVAIGVQPSRCDRDIGPEGGQLRDSIPPGRARIATAITAPSAARRYGGTAVRRSRRARRGNGCWWRFSRRRGLGQRTGPSRDRKGPARLPSTTRATAPTVTAGPSICPPVSSRRFRREESSRLVLIVVGWPKYRRPSGGRNRAGVCGAGRGCSWGAPDWEQVAGSFRNAHQIVGEGEADTVDLAANLGQDVGWLKVAWRSATVVERAVGRDSEGHLYQAPISSTGRARGPFRTVK